MSAYYFVYSDNSSDGTGIISNFPPPEKKFSKIYEFATDNDTLGKGWKIYDDYPGVEFQIDNIEFPPFLKEVKKESHKEARDSQRDQMVSASFLPYSSTNFQRQTIERDFIYRGIIVPLKKGTFPFLTIKYKIESVQLDADLLLKRLELSDSDEAGNVEKRVVIGFLSDHHLEQRLQLLDFNLRKFYDSSLSSLATNEEDGVIDFQQILYREVVVRFTHHSGFLVDNPTIILNKTEDYGPQHFRRGEEFIIPPPGLIDIETRMKKRGTFWVVEKRG